MLILPRRRESIRPLLGNLSGMTQIRGFRRARTNPPGTGRPFRRTIMTTIIRRMLGASASALLFAVSLGAAQTPETLRVRGTIESVDGPIFNVKTRDSAMLKLKLAENAPVRAVVKASLGDIKVG